MQVIIINEQLDNFNCNIDLPYTNKEQEAEFWHELYCQAQDQWGKNGWQRALAIVKIDGDHWITEFDNPYQDPIYKKLVLSRGRKLGS
jgi:hypothetical protein